MTNLPQIFVQWVNPDAGECAPMTGCIGGQFLRGRGNAVHEAGPLTQLESATVRSPHPRYIWLTLEGPEVIELKRVVLDRDAPGATAFFQRVVAPRVRATARQRGIPVESEDDEGLSG